ncbi:viral A-type inclusion protein [Reticulomyxa filosa]|uniref:Viral A-type inclusion protein n=1 Tax=Reticulomyxa filosa TaxID=46433 RepID=X6LUW7_RETFI|nr:viral A-type inclusion protein [Reticulomyxa filosa]|eukprot:ETO05186.1 viral A-type inclusion protein [Reticulomyxa filosa]
MAEEDGRKEIKDFLQVLREHFREQVFTYLFDKLACDDMESVLHISAERWRELFKETQLPEGQQPKLLKKLNEKRKESSLPPLDINTVGGNAEKADPLKSSETNSERSDILTGLDAKDDKDIKESVQKKAENEKESAPKDVEMEKQSTPKKDKIKDQGNVENKKNAIQEDSKNENETIEKEIEWVDIITLMFFNLQIENGALFLGIVAKIRLQHNSNVIVSRKDIQWKSLSLRQGEEIKCTYTLNEKKNVIVENIEWPPMYQEQITFADKTFFAFMKPYTETKKVLVIFPIDTVSGVTKLREGDILSFRLQFTPQKWMPVDVKIVERAAIRKIKDIPAPPAIKDKATSYDDIKKWLENPSQEQPSWEKWQNKELLKMGSTLLNLLQESQYNDDNESKIEQVIWQKTAIQFELIKEVIVKCIDEPCQVPDTLFHVLSSSGQSQDAKEDENAKRQTLQTQLRKLVEEFHEMTEEENRQHLYQKCADIVLEEESTVCEVQLDFPITDRIARIYIYCPETTTGKKKPIILFNQRKKRKYKKLTKIQKNFSEKWKEAQLVSDDFLSLYVIDLPALKYTIHIKHRNLRTIIDIDTQKYAYFVEMKKQDYWQKAQSMYNFVKDRWVENSSLSLNNVVVRHVIENIVDDKSFQFAQQALCDITKELQNLSKELKDLFLKMKGQLNNIDAAIKLIYQITFASEQLKGQRERLNPLELFYLAKCVVATPKCNIIETIRKEFWSDLEHNKRAEGIQQFMLIPCFNLLASDNTMRIHEELLEYFNFKHVNKTSQMAIRCIEIIETDLQIRRNFNIKPILFSEMHLMQILHSQKDNIMSEEILESLLSKKELVTVETWIKLCTTPDSKFSNVICNLYKCHFKKFSLFVEKLEAIGALKNERLCKLLLSIINEKDFQDALIQSKQDLISFIQKYDTSIWQNYEDVLQTLYCYIDKTDKIHDVNTIMTTFDMLWKHCPSESQSIERQVNNITQRLLKRLVAEEKSIELWLQLFTYQTQGKRQHILKELLLQSLNEWIDNKMIGTSIDSLQQLAQLLLCPNFWTLPNEYQTAFLIEIEKQQEILSLSSKKWNEKSLQSMKKLLEQTFVDSKVLDKIVEIVIDIPVQMDSDVSKGDIDKDKNVIEVKEENNDERTEDNEKKEEVFVEEPLEGEVFAKALTEEVVIKEAPIEEAPIGEENDSEKDHEETKEKEKERKSK